MGAQFFRSVEKKTSTLFFHVLTASHRTTGRQALQHTTDATDRETARRPLWRLAGARKDSANAQSRAPFSRKRGGVSGLTLSSFERSSGRRVAFCSLSTNLSAAQSHALTMRRAQARCTCKFALHEEGAVLREVVEWALCPPGNTSCYRMNPPAAVAQECSARARAEQAAGRVGAGAAPSACCPRTGKWWATCKEVTLAGAVEADNAVVHGTERPAHGLFAVRLEAMDAHFLDVHAVCLGARASGVARKRGSQHTQPPQSADGQPHNRRQPPAAARRAPSARALRATPARASLSRTRFDGRASALCPARACGQSALAPPTPAR